MSAFLLAFLCLGQASSKVVHLEAEDGQLHSTTISHARSGYSGTGYVTGFTGPNSRIVLHFKASPGIYEALIRFSTPSGEKGYGLRVNGSEVSGMFPKTGDRFDTASAGKVELKNGENEVDLENGWGYYDVDWIEFRPASIDSRLKPVPLKLADPQATPAAKALLAKIARTYGRQTLSGQYGDSDTDYIEKTAQRSPAIYGDDFMDYSPSRVARGSKTDGTTEHVIDRAHQGRIVTMSWHWNAPTGLIDKVLKDKEGKDIDARWYKGFYTNATTFDVNEALRDPNSADYKLLLRDIDAIAVQLKKISDAGVPVLWRPLHEAEGGWFWWGAKGPQPFVKLWRLMFDRLTRHHHLHNLVWVFTAGSNPAWYPGDKFVDVVGIDAYPSDHSDPLTNTWEPLKKQFDGKKLMAISEFGGVPDIPRMHKFGVDFAYFVSWPGGIKPPDTAPETLRRIYKDPMVKNR